MTKENIETPVFITFDELPAHGVPRFSRVHILRLMRRGQFPMQVQLTPNRVAWRMTSIQEWVANRPTSTRVRLETDEAA